jgi:hypothetical protein
MDGISAVFQFDTHLHRCTECKWRQESGGPLGCPILYLDFLCGEGKRLYDAEMATAYSTPIHR